MEMLIGTLATLGADPRAWLVAGLVAIKAAYSIYMVMRCPIQCGTFNVPKELAEEANREQFNPPLSYFVMMIVGIAMAIIGLFQLNSVDHGPLALGILVVGVFIFMTEPSRLRVNGARTAVFAATLKGPEAAALAREDMRDAQKQRAIFELSIAVLLMMALFLV